MDEHDVMFTICEAVFSYSMNDISLAWLTRTPEAGYQPTWLHYS